MINLCVAYSLRMHVIQHNTRVFESVLHNHDPQAYQLVCCVTSSVTPEVYQIVCCFISSEAVGEFYFT